MIKRFTQGLTLLVTLCFFTTLLAASPILINRTIAIVNNQVITQSDLDGAVAQIKTQIQQSGQTPPSTLDLQRHVLNQLILQSVASQLAKLNGIVVTSKDVDAAIQTIAGRNHLTMDKMLALVKQGGTSIASYRKRIHDQILVSRLEQKAVAGSIMLTPSEINNFIKQRSKQGKPNDQYEVQHILLALPAHPTPEDIAKTKQQTDKIIAQIKAKKLTFKQAAQKYSQASDALQGGGLGWKTLNDLPTIFVNAVQNMKPGEISAPIQSTGGIHIIKLLAKKAPDQARHFVEQYHVHQILIKLSPVVNNEQAKNLLNHILMDLKNGGDFGKLARAYTQNDAAHESNGDLGWITLAKQDPGFSEQVKSLAINKVSKPFATKSGWQIIEVLGKKKVDNTQAYEREVAAKALFQQKAEQAVQTWQAQIRGESYVKILVPELRDDNID